MDDTERYYEAHASEYCARTLSVDMGPVRERFLSLLPDGARVLDAGCGSGRDSLAFLRAGCTVTAMDASEAVCREAERNTGLEVMRLSFGEMGFLSEFDGVWACASLLHVREEDLPGVLGKVRRALKPSGVLYCSFKEGTGSRTDADGRYYLDLDGDALRARLEDAGFRVAEIFATVDTLEERDGIVWINALASTE